MNLQHVMSDFEREFRLEQQADRAENEHIAMNGVATLYLSGRVQDLPDAELDALVEHLRVEQRERDGRRESMVIPDRPFLTRNEWPR